MTPQAGKTGLRRVLYIIVEIIQDSRIHIKIVQIIIPKRFFRFLELIQYEKIVPHTDPGLIKVIIILWEIIAGPDPFFEVFHISQYVRDIVFLHRMKNPPFLPADLSRSGRCIWRSP